MYGQTNFTLSVVVVCVESQVIYIAIGLLLFIKHVYAHFLLCTKFITISQSEYVRPMSEYNSTVWSSALFPETIYNKNS